MKRASEDTISVAQNKKQKKMYDCPLCLESLVYTTETHECRRCKINLCDDCMYKHMVSSIERCSRYGKTPRLECPCCRLAHWFPPKFVMECEGREYKEDMSIRIKLMGREPVYLHGLHDGKKFVGLCCLEHTDGFYDKEQSFKYEDRASLLKYGKPLVEIAYEMKRFPYAILSSEDDMEHVMAKFREAGCRYIKHDDDIVTPDLVNFLFKNINPF